MSRWRLGLVAGAQPGSAGDCSRLSGVWLPVLVVLLFFGAMFWAKGRDPFQRIWFKVKVPGQGKAECIAVVPKNSPKFNVQSPTLIGANFEPWTLNLERF